MNSIFFFGEVIGGTALLLLSSVAFNVYKAHYDSYDTSEYFTLNGKITQLLGIAFVSLQLAEYTASNVSIYTAATSSGFFMVTGFHGIHVIVGLILIIQQHELATLEMRSGVNVGLFYSLIYWHFVDAVWVFVLLIIYVGQTSTLWSLSI
jgi:cytochrome c oxidase subunit 3